MAKKARAKARRAVKAVKPVPRVAGTCSGCGYWDALDAAPDRAPALGFCRVASPALLTSTAGTATAAWPITRDADWCGQWAAK